MDSLADLQWRRSLCTPGDAVPGMFFKGMVDLVRREAGEAPAEAVRTTRAMPSRLVSFLRYPARDYLDVVEGAVLALTAAKGISEDQALRSIGMCMISTFMDGPVGKTMISMLGGAPHRMMGGAASAYTVTFSFGKRLYYQRSPSEGAFACQGELLGPAITEGVLLRGLELSCPVKVTTAVEDQRDTTHFTVVTRWERSG